MNRSSIQRIFLEAKASLELARTDAPIFLDVLNFMKTQNFSAENISEIHGRVPAHKELLRSAISKVPDNPFLNLKSALLAGYEHLHWRVDDSGFYAKGADVGHGYRSGNMHALLIGPEDCPFQADDFLLGFFLLAPNTLYRDHNHLAPEIYIPLTGPSGWRFEQGAWEDHFPGEMIYNAPGVVHATRVYETPFFALFAWSQDVESACNVVFADDWESIETELLR
ncbi:MULTISPECIES: dimethylsulfonioproprionate lyase family protein [unclassified Roseovarius]|uniref:dimethylsulfonioproprionate lyase family protein n=1 Tax=unclassified Roseovarius TaxID=2614913 RepID=UPI00273E229E|nr:MULTISPECIES: dimethylsulfonioproprionate lyase family protein [unclassified Roseovarius]